MLASIERHIVVPWAPSRVSVGKRKSIVSVSVVGGLLALVWAADIFLLPNWGSYQGKIFGGVFLIAIETFLICWLVQQQIKERRVETKSGEERQTREEFPPREVPAGALLRASARDPDVAINSAQHFALDSDGVWKSIECIKQDATGESVDHFIRGTISTSVEVNEGLPEVAMGNATGRVLAEAFCSNTSGRLIEAQEEERRRIAREIHDDYNQRLAVIAIDIEELAANIEHTDLEASQKLHQLWNCVSELGNDLHALSHSLHSSTLENLGLVAGVRAFCEEFSDQQDMRITFTHKDVPPYVSEEMALCLFRVVQEAVRNVKRHSGTQRAEVLLERRGETLHLSVADHGRGFDLKDRLHHGGIGIRSMEERLHLLGGCIEIHSYAGKGTTVEAWLPVSKKVSAIS